MEPKHLELYSSLSPSDCAERLSQAIDRERVISFSFTGSHPVAGRVDGSSFRIRQRLHYRNSFQTFLAGSIQPQGTGSIIRGDFAMHGFVRAFMPVWFGGVALLGSVFFVVALLTIFAGTSSQRSGAWAGLVVPPLMFVFGIALVRFGRYLARDEARFLTDFLRETLQANDNTRNV